MGDDQDRRYDADNEKTGSQLVHIPYSGAGDVLNDLVAGRVQLNMNNVPSFLPHIEADAVQPLAIAAEERSSLLPDVPTTGEAGLDDFVMGSWYALLGPAGMPEEAVSTLFEAMSTLEKMGGHGLAHRAQPSRISAIRRARGRVPWLSEPKRLGTVNTGSPAVLSC